MPGISIDVDAQQHKQLKAMALLNGQNIKDYVLSRTIADVPEASSMSDEEAIEALKLLLAPRIKSVEAGNFSSATADDIIAKGKPGKAND